MSNRILSTIVYLQHKKPHLNNMLQITVGLNFGNSLQVKEEKRQHIETTEHELSGQKMISLWI